MKLNIANLHGVTAALLLSAITAAANEITFDIGASSGVKQNVSAPFNLLNGISLQGQTISINFVFGPGHFGRLFTASDSSLTAGLSLQTNWSGSPGFLDGTGYLFDQQGQQIIPLQPPQLLGSADNNGLMFAALFPLQTAGLKVPRDFAGIHFDLTLPDTPSALITTGSSFDLFFSDNNPSARFGIGPGIPRDIVPEGTATVLLFSIGLAGIAVGRVYFAGRVT